MKRFSLSLSLFLFLTITLRGQNKPEYDVPINIRDGEHDLPGKIDITWSPPSGWVHSVVDMWYDYDKGIWSGNSLGSCADCPAEAAVRWNAEQLSMYDTVYLTKIRYVLVEPPINYRLRVYQGSPDSFDTLLNFPLIDSLVYNRYDTLNIEPIQLDTSKDLWIGYWVNSLASGYPLPLDHGPAVVGYGNMFRFGPSWETLTDINPELDYNWSIGGYLETPHDSVIYPVFNIYRAYDNLPYEKINDGFYFDTVYFDDILNHEAALIHYYVTCVYESGESATSDTLTVSMVYSSEIVQKNNIKIFPNPAKDRVSIESSKGKIKSLSLINSNGEIIMDQPYDSEKIEIDVSDLPGSFYIVRMITNDGVFTSKLLITN